MLAPILERQIILIKEPELRICVKRPVSSVADLAVPEHCQDAQQEVAEPQNELGVVLALFGDEKDEKG